MLIPFNQAYGRELYDSVAEHRAAHPEDCRVAVIDLGQGVRRALDNRNGPELVAPGEKRNALLGGLHPNDRGYAHLASLITPQVFMILVQQGLFKPTAPDQIIGRQPKTRAWIARAMASGEPLASIRVRMPSRVRAA